MHIHPSSDSHIYNQSRRRPISLQVHPQTQSWRGVNPSMGSTNVEFCLVAEKASLERKLGEALEESKSHYVMLQSTLELNQELKGQVDVQQEEVRKLVGEFEIALREKDDETRKLLEEKDREIEEQKAKFTLDLQRLDDKFAKEGARLERSAERAETDALCSLYGARRAEELRQQDRSMHVQEVLAFKMKQEEMQSNERRLQEALINANAQLERETQRHMQTRDTLADMARQDAKRATAAEARARECEEGLAGLEAFYEQMMQAQTKSYEESIKEVVESCQLSAECRGPEEELQQLKTENENVFRELGRMEQEMKIMEQEMKIAVDGMASVDKLVDQALSIKSQ